MAQDILTYLVVGIAFALVAYRIWRKFTASGDKPSGGGCSGCSGGGCCH